MVRSYRRSAAAAAYPDASWGNAVEQLGAPVTPAHESSAWPKLRAGKPVMLADSVSGLCLLRPMTVASVPARVKPGTGTGAFDDDGLTSRWRQ